MENLSRRGNSGSTMLNAMNARIVKQSLTFMKALSQNSQYPRLSIKLSVRGNEAESGEQRSRN
jgi:hypothetical protein